MMNNRKIAGLLDKALPLMGHRITRRIPDLDAALQYLPSN